MQLKLLKLFLFLFLLSSCTKDQNEITSETSESSIDQEQQYNLILKYYDLNTDSTFQEIQSKIQNLKFNKSGNKIKVKYSDDIQLDPSADIHKTIANGLVSYTFRILENRLNYFENLVIILGPKNVVQIDRISYSITDGNIVPIRIENIVLTQAKKRQLLKGSCENYLVRWNSWCSENVHYGYNSNCRATISGQTIDYNYQVCTGGATELMSTENITSTGGGSTSGTGDGSSTEDPAEIGDFDPISDPVIEENLVSYKPMFRYPVNSNYENRFPKLTEYLRRKLPQTRDMPIITDALMEVTNQSLAQIKYDLEWGNGPIIIIEQLDNYAINTDARTVGLFDKDSPQFVYLDIDYVNAVENETEQYKADGLIFYLGVVLLHEYAHFGDSQNGFDFEGEEGRVFETKAYGEDLDPGSAEMLILNKYY